MSSRFAAGSIPKLLLSLALPAIAAQIVNALYNVVDRMLIGRMPGGGTSALTGLGIAFPLIMTISAFAALIGLGGAPLASMQLGEGKPKEAEKLLGSCCLMLLLVSGVLTAVLLCFHCPLLIAFGASGKTLPYASDYMGIYLLGTVSVLMSLGLNSFISIQGFAKTAMATVCAGAVLNAILAPLFIFPMHMGVRGAALATVISQTASAIWVLSFLTSRRSHLRLRLRNLRVNPRMACRILALGLSPFIMQSTESLIQIVFNISLARYGGDLYVGAISILTSLMQLFSLPLSSFAQGAQPVIGYNYGSGDHARVKAAIRFCTAVCGVLGIVMWAVAVFLPRFPAMIFTDQAELIALTERLMPVFFLGTCIYGIQLALQQMFLALGQAKVSIFIAVLRKIILLVPLVFVLPEFISPKADAVIMAEPIADACAAVTCCILFAATVKRLLRNPDLASTADS